jgi:hypothetical protein
LSQQRGDRLSRTAFDDGHAARDLARVVLCLIEAVVIRLPRFGDAGVAQLDDPAGHGPGRPTRPVEHDRNRVSRLHAKANGRHFINSLTSSNASAWVVNAP